MRSANLIIESQLELSVLEEGVRREVEFDREGGCWCFGLRRIAEDDVGQMLESGDVGLDNV